MVVVSERGLSSFDGLTDVQMSPGSSSKINIKVRLT